ncbi:MAG: hypothetical protein H0X26_04080 [Alphaproteobacteria bacterium]|nr:hypothetical protein [Alphaproteobacteria bacterium]
MNVFMKKCMVLIATLMIGTSCFAMDLPPVEQVKGIGKALPKPTAREMERELEVKTTIPPMFVSAPPIVFDLDLFSADLAHHVLVTAAEEVELEDFTNMVLVSSKWFHILTGTGAHNPSSHIYPEKYSCTIPFDTGFENYSTSLFLKELHRINITRQFDIMAQTLPPFIVLFPNPKALTHLNLNGQRIGDEGLNSITMLSNLESLNVSYCDLRNPKVLAGCNKLRNICATFNDLENWTFLSPLTSCLATLTISKSSQMNLDCLPSLACLTSLTVGANLSNISLRPFSTFENLTELNLSGCMINTLSDLESLTKLQILNLGYNPLESDWLPLTLNNLTTLNVGCTNLNENSGRALERLTALKNLNAHGNPSSFLPFLPESIQYLNLVSVEAVEENFGSLPSNLKSLGISRTIFKDAVKMQEFFTIVMKKKIKEIRIQDENQVITELKDMKNIIMFSHPS